jgi:hypothetical protein
LTHSTLVRQVFERTFQQTKKQLNPTPDSRVTTILPTCTFESNPKANS